MKVELFDFKKNWDLVKPHLNDPEVVELLDQGMLRFCPCGPLTTPPITRAANAIIPQ